MEAKFNRKPLKVTQYESKFTTVIYKTSDIILHKLKTLGKTGKRRDETIYRFKVIFTRERAANNSQILDTFSLRDDRVAQVQKKVLKQATTAGKPIRSTLVLS